MAAEFSRLDKTFVLCSHPPICVLFQRDAVKHEPFPEIGRDCIPVFAQEFPVRINQMYITRRQVPMSPAFALTDYKVQGSTYQNAVLDLSWRSKAVGENASHKRYCSVYVQLSRLRSLKGVRLLQPVTFNDVNNKMHPQLYKEDSRLEQLAAETIRSWT